MPIDDILLDCEEVMEKSVEHVRHELRGLRTGRASPALVEDIRVDYYGTPTAIKSIAAISIPEATQIVIKPFSPQDIKAIEKAISDSKLGLSAKATADNCASIFPPCRRSAGSSSSHRPSSRLRSAKITIRAARRDANKILETEEKGGVVTEDDAKKGKEQIQELTKQYEGKIDELIDHKSKEIMQV